MIFALSFRDESPGNQDFDITLSLPPSFICIEQILHGSAEIRHLSSSVEKYFTLCHDFKNALCLSSVQYLLVQLMETASFWDDG